MIHIVCVCKGDWHKSEGESEGERREEERGEEKGGERRARERGERRRDERNSGCHGPAFCTPSDSEASRQPVF